MDTTPLAMEMETLTADLTKKHCDFKERCGIAGPWIRATYLNIPDSISSCPCVLRKFVNGPAAAFWIKYLAN